MSNTPAPITPNAFLPIKERFASLTDGDTYAREVSFACQILAKNQYLAGAQTQSIQIAVMNVAQIGLSLNPALRLAYLVPRYDRAAGGVICVLEPSYQGLVKLLTDGRTVTQIEARIIWEGDDVDVDFAAAKKVKAHKPYILTGRPRGAMMAVYSVAVLHDGTHSIEVMSREDVEMIRERSESYKKAKEGKGSSVWVTDEGEMWRKTVIKRHFKYLPKSGAYEAVAKAIEVDNRDYPCTIAQLGMIEVLLLSSTIDERRKTQIEREANDYSVLEAEASIRYLQEHQPTDPRQMLQEMAQERDFESKIK